MATPLISVVLPVHNRETMVADAVNSIRQQSFTDWELVVVDDGSTDGTRETVKSLAGNDVRIRLIAVEKQPAIPHVRNICLQNARGALIANMDSDDISHPERLARLVALLQSSPAVSAVSCWAQELDAAGNEYRLYRTALHPLDLFIETPLHDPIVHGASLIRRDALLEVGGYDEAYHYGTEDSRLWVSLALKGHRFAAIPEILYTIRWHTHNTSTNPHLTQFSRRAYGSFWGVTEAEYPVRALGRIDEALAFLAGRVVIWGTGKAGDLMLDWLEKQSRFQPVAFVDSDPAKWGSRHRQLPVLSPREMKSASFDKIAIASLSGQVQIETELQRYGYSREKDYMPVMYLLTTRERLCQELADDRK